jgi:hypothetical protein
VLHHNPQRIRAAVTAQVTHHIWVVAAWGQTQCVCVWCGGGGGGAGGRGEEEDDRGGGCAMQRGNSQPTHTHAPPVFQKRCCDLCLCMRASTHPSHPPTPHTSPYPPIDHPPAPPAPPLTSQQVDLLLDSPQIFRCGLTQ